MASIIQLRTSARGEYLADAYGHLDVFQTVDFNDIADLVGRCEIIQVNAHETLLVEGRENHALYQIVSGRLQVMLDGVSNTPIATFGAGACIGELSILTQRAVAANVIALEPSRLLVIEEEVLWTLIRRCHPFACNLLTVLCDRVRDTNDRLRSSIRAEKHSAKVARIDSLTGLYNRRWLDEVLLRECQQCLATQLPLSLMMIDIDFFKHLNDQHGHLVGDEVLRIVGLRLANTMRNCGLAIRYGGEEFAVLMPGVNLEDARAAAEEYRSGFERTALATTVGSLNLSVSIGLSELEPRGTARKLMRAADQALYRAKSLGRNRIETLPHTDSTVS